MGRARRLIDRIWAPRRVKDHPPSKGDDLLSSMVDRLLEQPGGDPDDTAQQDAALARAELAVERGDVVGEERAILEGYWLAERRGGKAVERFRSSLELRRAQGQLRRGVYFGTVGYVMLWSDRISAVHGAVCPVDADLVVRLGPTSEFEPFVSRSGVEVRGVPGGVAPRGQRPSDGSLGLTIDHPLAGGIVAVEPDQEGEVREMVSRVDEAIRASARS